MATPLAPADSVLIVVDIQRGFDDASWWGRRNNPDCEANVRALVDAFDAAGAPVVLVRHDSTDPGSPLRPGTPGNDFKAILDGVSPALVVPKHVHSAFNGEVDLAAWLGERQIHDLVVCGIQTNRCAETTTRVAGDLGYRVLFALDATHTFDEPGLDGGDPLPADLIARVTAANLHGHFAEVVTTRDAVARLGAIAKGVQLIG